MEVNIEDQDIIDVLTTALEGGSNYWYYLPALPQVEKAMPREEHKDLALSERIAMSALLHDVVIPVHDCEDIDEHLGDISKENIQRGLKLYIENQGEFAGDLDANEADIFFQYVVLGEIVFG